MKNGWVFGIFFLLLFQTSFQFRDWINEMIINLPFRYSHIHPTRSVIGRPPLDGQGGIRFAWMGVGARIFKE